MRVVVAGSSGLIGTALVAKLRNGGDEVLRLVRREPQAPDERQWDPPSGAVEEGTFAGVDAVVNLCGAGIADRRWSQARKQELIDSRIEPTEVIAAAVAEFGVPVLLNGSAVGIYGTIPAGPADETEPAGRGFLAELCVRWEAATAAAAAAGARVVLARTAQVLSPSGGLLGPLRPLFALGLGGKLGSGRQYMPWIHLDDEVDALAFLLREDISGPVNLAGPTPATNAEFTRAFGRARNRPAPFRVPQVALKVALGDFAEEILRSQHLVPKVLQDHGFPFRYDTVDDALTAIEQR
ncbi:TIGR01777 family oxidoreductase [Actinokineospora bangkokensis]|uniref:TIGR01777 family protein n=1 Tax=Actinokineospora bangkokensis TaxID=1193682 RepID=A0A1Q9LTC4_9PSEU|nr:TIGR01777 family oxidoreductase [Actinokineospora bangkokensis]OLR95251.1 TIGR01777 family protein [Actinokineospora bangkokensis]